MGWHIQKNPKSFSQQVFYTLPVSQAYNGWIPRYHHSCVGFDLTWFPGRQMHWPSPLYLCRQTEMDSGTEKWTRNDGVTRWAVLVVLLHPFRERHLPIEVRMWWDAPGNPSGFSEEPGTKPQWHLLFSLRQTVRPPGIGEQVSDRAVMPWGWRWGRWGNAAQKGQVICPASTVC